MTRTPPPLSDVAVLGLGPMGAPIAHNLLVAGWQTMVWNRTPSVTRDPLFAGAVVAPSVGAIRASVVLSVLPDVPQLEQHLDDGILSAWGEAGTVLVVMSTTSPERVRALAVRCAPFGVKVADAPMSGGDRGAREGTLSIMLGAEAEVAERVMPLLETIGTTVIRCGEVGSGAIAKLTNQVVVAGTLAVLAEALSIAERAGIDLEALTRLFRGGLAASAVLDLKLTKLLGREYSLGGSTRNQVKDLDYALETAVELGADHPLTEVLAELYRTTALEHADADHSAVLETYLGGRAGRR